MKETQPQKYLEALRRILLNRLGAYETRIFLLGSMARGDFRRTSDIDIAVEGIADTETFFELYGKALALTSFPLDVVDLARIEPAHADSIRGRGRLVYERT